MTLYQQKANTIITDAIKSAIFIDEKALGFYDNKSDDEIIEEQLSIDLFQNFKENGISLAVHKFLPTDILDSNIKNYLFEDRDLVLLDWDLGSEKYSLQLLGDIVNRPHIHFCAIYTSNPSFDEIFNNVISFFSDKTEEDFDHIKDGLDAYQDDLEPILSQVSIDDIHSNGKLIKQIITIDNELLNQIKVLANCEPKKALKLVKIAFDSNFIKSDTSNKSPEIIDRENNVIVIGNTIITILQKDKELDKDTKELIKKLSIQIAESNNSFTQLLGLEMQNIFSRKGAFIDSNLLKVSKETIAYHRRKLIEETDSDFIFTEMMKTVLIEHANLSLSDETLSILEPALLEEILNTDVPKDEELISMNVFYNSLILKKDKKLNFGDVFKDKNGKYYLCITALCDCYIPTKIKNIYFFATGTIIDATIALKLGDSGFVNFLPTGQIVVWSNVDDDPTDGDFSKFKYTPIYIKPTSYHVKNPILDNNSIEIRRVFEHEKKGEELEFISLTYITTLKPTYAQRIANHAFAHPIRVGIDFVKKI